MKDKLYEIAPRLLESEDHDEKLLEPVRELEEVEELELWEHPPVRVVDPEGAGIVPPDWQLAHDPQTPDTGAAPVHEGIALLCESLDLCRSPDAALDGEGACDVEDRELADEAEDDDIKGEKGQVGIPLAVPPDPIVFRLERERVRDCDKVGERIGEAKELKRAVREQGQ